MNTVKGLPPGVICVCTRLNVPHSLLPTLWGLEKPAETALIVSEGTNLARQRNNAVELLGPQAEWLLFLDDDVIVPPDTLTRLYSHKVPIVSALGLVRKPPYQSLAGWLSYSSESGERSPKFLTPEDMASNKLIEVDYAATACLLIRVEVFRSMDPPWFEIGKPNSVTMGEDVTFCLKAKELGFPTYVDTSVRMGHQISAVVFPNDKGNPSIAPISLARL